MNKSNLDDLTYDEMRVRPDGTRVLVTVHTREMCDRCGVRSEPCHRRQRGEPCPYKPLPETGV